jgi:hypothetical protein
MFLEFPTEDEWQVIEETYPLKNLKIFKSESIAKKLLQKYLVTNRLTILCELQDWEAHLKTRLNDVRISYVMMFFYFQKCIPDDEYYVYDEKTGSERYFPHFGEKDYCNLIWFRYHSDIFFYKLFSAWDNLAHIINIIYNMKIYKPDFSLKGLGIESRELEKSNENLSNRLKFEILNDSDFNKVRLFRNDVTHNLLPSQINFLEKSVQEKAKGKVKKEIASFGIGKYARSKKVANSSRIALKLFDKTLSIVHDEIEKDDNSKS